jgi:P27 family predicted phage terminase small subunit
MGERGPKPTSAIVKALRGNPGRRPLNLDEGVHPAVCIPDPPDWLNAEARAEWDRVTDELVELGLVAEIDLASLATYCQTFGDLAQLERAFAAQRGAIERVRPDPHAATLGAHFIRTPTQFLRPSPVYDRILELRLLLDRLVRNFGGNASARSRVTPSDNVPSDQDAPADDRPTAEVKSFANWK